MKKSAFCVIVYTKRAALYGGFHNNRDTKVVMIIDSHVHVFPDALAPKVISALTEKAQKTVGGVVPFTDGTERDTREKLREWGVDYGIIAPIATKVGQQKKINDFAIQINHGNFICYGSVHPDDPEAIDELYRICLLYTSDAADD